ncbi:MAG TPA: RMD1 family protein [Bacillota bacterium]|nr:RMD1 family protein [Bacillota bacterium]HOL10198.1 RMD1 family protein [Bacillota bacterium]HPO97200.1 RMD1 family protein [Bacillota bacterium]
MKFNAYAITNEFDLNKIAAQCGIPRKYTWEEPLVLSDQILGSILEHEITGSQRVFVFSFGSIVFINTPPADQVLFINYLKKYKPDLVTKDYERYSDDYELREKPDLNSETELIFTDQYAEVPVIEAYYPELISIIIAKSVALERAEEQMEIILDMVENLIDRLEKAKFRISTKKLARITAKIIRHQYNIIAYVMILDKPEITWTNSDAALFYDQMSDFFELNDRYAILEKKTDILNVIIDNFSSISHSIRGLFVEWLIVVLILVEVVLMVADLIKP